MSTNAVSPTSLGSTNNNTGSALMGELGPPSVASGLLGKRRDKPRQGGDTVK